MTSAMDLGTDKRSVFSFSLTPPPPPVVGFVGELAPLAGPFAAMVLSTALSTALSTVKEVRLTAALALND